MSKITHEQLNKGIRNFQYNDGDTTKGMVLLANKPAIKSLFKTNVVDHANRVEGIQLQPADVKKPYLVGIDVNGFFLIHEI